MTARWASGWAKAPQTQPASATSGTQLASEPECQSCTARRAWNISHSIPDSPTTKYRRCLFWRRSVRGYPDQPPGRRLLLGLRLVLSFLLHPPVQADASPTQQQDLHLSARGSGLVAHSSPRRRSSLPPSSSFFLFIDYFSVFAVIDGVTTQWCTQLNLSPDANNTIILGSSLSSTLPLMLCCFNLCIKKNNKKTQH